MRYPIQAVYPGDEEVLEPGLGLLAYMTLRQPEVVTLCAEVGGAKPRAAGQQDALVAIVQQVFKARGREILQTGFVLAHPSVAGAAGHTLGKNAIHFAKLDIQRKVCTVDCHSMTSGLRTGHCNHWCSEHSCICAL